MNNIALKNAEIASIIHGRPAASLSRLPAVWHKIAVGTDGSLLSATARRDYVEAAQLFRFHGTPLAMESLEAIGADFARDAYPDFTALKAEATTVVAKKTVAAVEALFAEFGYDVPAAFYDVILATALRDRPEDILGMFKDKKELMRDRLWDAVLHAMLLVTPVGLRVQSVLSQHGLRFMHVMNCGCSISESDETFSISLDANFKAAYLQNMMAASFEQYGVNASTSRVGRGF